MESALTDIPCNINKKAVDYKTSMEVYENYRARCTDSYIFGIDKVFTIRTDQLLTPPPDIIIHDQEQRKVETVMHYLLKIPEKNK